MPLTSNPLSEYDIVDMSKAVPVIFEHRTVIGKCDCYNDIYLAFDPDCGQCDGTGQISDKSGSRLTRAVMKSKGGMVDDDEPIAYAYTFDDDISIGDIIVCEGQKYRVIEVSTTNTLSKQEVIVCGLNYARNYNHNQADLERYR